MRRRLTRKEKRNKTKKIIITTSISFLFIMVVGYAAFNTQLSLKAKGNILKKFITPENLKENVVESGDGLYKDIYEEGRYIYKGTNPSNYIEFNNELWRIISVENDNALKIVKTKSIGIMAWDDSDYCPNKITYNNYSQKFENSHFYVTDNIIFLAGSMFGCNDWLQPADINTYLNGEYLSTITSNQDRILPHTWSIGKVTTGNSDLVNQINSENGTKTQNSSVGLITASEYLRANSNTEQCGTISLNNDNTEICKTTNWLLMEENNFWTISAAENIRGDVIYINSGIIDSMKTVTEFLEIGKADVFPSLYLSPDITLKGEGTEKNPYIIENS